MPVAEMAPAKTAPKPSPALAAGTRTIAPSLAGSLIIDARMLFHSGIGRYLREVLCRWPVEPEVHETYLYNTAEQLDWLSRIRPGAKFVQVKAGIYSLKEQTLAAFLPADAVYWVPHYNLPWVSRARLVTTVHDAAPLALPEIFRGLAHRLAARFYFGAVRRTSRRIIAVSRFTAEELVRLARVAPEKITVVCNGVSPEWLQPGNPAVRLPSRLLFVGNLKAHKNLGRLIDALELLRQQGLQDITLDVVGQTTGFRHGLETGVAARLASAPWIRLHGSVKDDDLRTLYASAGALVFPSVYEGFGLPMLEAMAAGCPVLAANTASLPEIGGPDQATGGAVIYFDPKDAAAMAGRIEYFLNLTHGERLRLSAASMARVRQFSWDEAARQTRAVLLAELNPVTR